MTACVFRKGFITGPWPRTLMIIHTRKGKSYMINREDLDVRDVIHLFFLLDNSGSMSGASIQTLNEAMVNTMSELKAEADRKEVTAMMHILSFNSSIRWLCNTSAEEGLPVENINWADISANGGTNTASAIRSILPGLSRRLLGHHAYRPIIVLITDGYSDNRAETQQAIQELLARQKTINVAVGVSGYNDVELNDFASEGTVLHKDGLGNVIGTVTGCKFIFPVADAQNLAKIIGEVATSSLISSILEKKEESGESNNEGEQAPTITITDTATNPVPNTAPDPRTWVD